jgi:hypothetical protein
MIDWFTHGIWTLVLVIFCAASYKIGARRSRRDVIHTFDDILKRIYQLVWSGRQEELSSFLAEVCEGVQLPADQPKIIRHNKKGEGYKQ